MKKILILLHNNKLVAVLILCAIFSFYWFSYRPMKIKETCSERANFWAKDREIGTDFIENQKIYDVAYNSTYKECLNYSGL